MADGRVSKSPYERGKRLMLLGVLSMFLIVWGVPILASGMGLSAGVAVGALVLPLGVVWVLAGGIGSFLIGCPRCGKSLFMRGIFSVPWPARKCSKCGCDLTARGQSERKA